MLALVKKPRPCSPTTSLERRALPRSMKPLGWSGEGTGRSFGPDLIGIRFTRVSLRRKGYSEHERAGFDTRVFICQLLERAIHHSRRSATREGQSFRSFLLRVN